MLVALARRIRVDLMPDYEMDVNYWFWELIFSEFCQKIPPLFSKIRHFFPKNGQKSEKKVAETEKKVAESDEIWKKIQQFLAENYDI
jgi:hypothetical protein